MNEQTCRNCKWAHWQMTNHQPPRVNVRLPGKCLFPTETIKVPSAAMLDYYGSRKIHTVCIVADNPHDNCPTWEPN